MKKLGLESLIHSNADLQKCANLKVKTKLSTWDETALEGKVNFYFILPVEISINFLPQNLRMALELSTFSEFHFRNKI